MNRLLANVSGGMDEAKARIKNLHKEYPKFKFEAVQHDTRAQIIVKDWDPKLGEADYNSLRQAAQIHVPVSSDAKAAVKGPSEKMMTTKGGDDPLKDEVRGPVGAPPQQAGVAARP